MILLDNIADEYTSDSEAKTRFALQESSPSSRFCQTLTVKPCVLSMIALLLLATQMHAQKQSSSISNSQLNTQTLKANGSGIVTALETQNSGDFSNKNTFRYNVTNINNLDIAPEIVKGQGSGTMLTAVTGAINMPSTASVFMASAINGFVVNPAKAKNGLAGYFYVRGAADDTYNFGINPLVIDTPGLKKNVVLVAGEFNVVPVNTPTAYSSLVGIQSIIAGPGPAGGFPGTSAAFLSNTNTKVQWNYGFWSKAGSAAIGGIRLDKMQKEGAGGSQPLQFVANNGKDIVASVSEDSSGSVVIKPSEAGSLLVPRIVVNGDASFSSAPRMALTGFAPSLNGEASYAAYVTEKPVVITRLTVTQTRGSASCSAFPQVSIFDVSTRTALISVTESPSLFIDSGPANVSVPADHTLMLRVTSRGQNCGSNAADANITMQYRMQ